MDKQVLRIAESICRWNELRYERVYDEELTTALLDEERAELDEATTLLEQADAYADIFYISIGAIWKRGSDPHHIKTILCSYADQIKRYGMVRSLQSGYLSIVAMSALDRLTALTGDVNLALDIIEAVCISNNTKSTNKIISGAKYSHDGKGSRYVSPTKAILQILEKVTND